MDAQEVETRARHGYELGQAYAAMTSAESLRAQRLAEAADRGAHAAAVAGRSSDAETAADRLVRVSRYEPNPLTHLMVTLPAGTELAHEVLMFGRVDVLTQRPVIEPAARRSSGMDGHYLFRVLDVAAGRELAALVADGVRVVAEPDDGGRLLARVAGDSELLGEARAARPTRSGGCPHVPDWSPFTCEACAPPIVDD